MNTTAGIFIRSTSLALALGSLALSGCSGMDQAAFPAVPVQGVVGSIQGSVLGGHAPIVGAHVFLLEATWTGYAAKAKSLLGSSAKGVTEDQTADSATNGLYYVTSDANGAFNVTGDYTCDVGFPVYLYAAGGAPDASLVINITSISESVSGSTYTYTFTASNQLYTGQSVQFSSSSLGGKWATLNGTTQTVLATPTWSSFQISTTTAPGSGANTQSGSVTTVGASNPAIVNTAMLGVCPGVGNFTTSISYVYMNEVATGAMAYAMAGFATDSLHMGASIPNEIGLQNAALNAASLYNIEGAPLELAGNSSAGEGQIANQTTVAGNGAVVPQAELNTLGNILAACVDSANTASSASAACVTLFSDATSTGTSSGVKPIDIASAAINMAHNPGAANVIALWELPSGAVPFTPHLTAAPKDFTVAVTYTGIATPGGIAIDANGNAYVPTNSTSGYVTKLSPQGAVVATSSSGGGGFDSIAVAPSGNIFVAANASNAVYQYTGSLAAVSGSPWTNPTMTAPTSVVVDSSGTIYVTDGAASIIRKFTSSGTLSASITNGCLAGVSQISLDTAGYLWASSYSKSDGCRVANPGGAYTFDLGGSVLEPGNLAIDSNGKGWAPLGGANQLAGVTPAGSGAEYGGGGDGLSTPTWIAIDGADNLWVTNNGNSYALSEYNGSGTVTSPSAGYQGGNLNTPSWIAIDASGDVWVPNKGANSVTELIGAATPTVTPLSALEPGVRP